MNEHLKVSYFFPQEANKTSKEFGSKEEVSENSDENIVTHSLLEMFVFRGGGVQRALGSPRGLLAGPTNRSLPIFFSAQQQRRP